MSPKFRQDVRARLHAASGKRPGIFKAIPRGQSLVQQIRRRAFQALHRRDAAHDAAGRAARALWDLHKEKKRVLRSIDARPPRRSHRARPRRVVRPLRGGAVALRGDAVEAEEEEEEDNEARHVIQILPTHTPRESMFARAKDGPGRSCEDVRRLQATTRLRCAAVADLTGPGPRFARRSRLL